MSFSLDVKKFADLAGLDAVKAIRVAALEIFPRIIIESPVDTGRFRNNWNTSLGAPDYSTTTQVDPSGSNSKGKISAVIRNLQGDQSAFLSNGLPYAQRLEYGWSKQAPSGMVRVNIKRFSQAVDKAAKAKRR